MPIRMVEDPKGDDQNKRRQPNQPRTGGGGLGKLIPFALMFLLKRPKLIIPALIIGAIAYFMFGGGGLFNANTGGGGDYSDIDFSMGASLSEEMFDKAKVFEPLSTTYGNGSRLPSSVSLLKYVPRRLHQGQQGSCVGWAAAYGARTILHARATGYDPNSVAFSPSYLYNQIALRGCQGAYMLDAMKAMKSNGGVPFNEFRYDERSCSTSPDRSLVSTGQQFRIKGYNRLTVGGNDLAPDIPAIKQNLAQGAPVVIGMMVGGTFMSRMVGQDVWYPTQSDYYMRGFGGHAMCLVGYDDNKEGGAFQIMNSWGEDWGNRGIAWVRYQDFLHFNKEAYGLYPMGNAQEMDPNKLAVEFGLVDVNTKQPIALAQNGDITFRNQQPLRKGDKFKILVANSVECYVYVFGQETDGSSYVLFPYTEKHSPYCGIVGTRVFPRDYSMQADELGNQDYMAVVVSKRELDWNAVNNAINQSGGNYAQKVASALGSYRNTRTSFQTGQTVAFTADVSGGDDVVATIIQLDKQ